MTAREFAGWAQQFQHYYGIVVIKQGDAWIEVKPDDIKIVTEIPPKSEKNQ